jgi:hypothetical protein
MKRLIEATLFLMVTPLAVHAQDVPPYTTYTSFSQVLEGINARYLSVTRVSDPGTTGHPTYTGFFFYQCLQFDPTGRYVLGMRVYFQNRLVEPTDRADIGFIDLKDRFKWTKIGETTAWNWQQGARLQWRPGSDEILWNDRSEDGKKYVCRLYNFRTGNKRTLPRPIYDLSPDGATALTHDFERMKHGGTAYVGIDDAYKSQYAPKNTGIWKMNMDTGNAELIMSLERMSGIAYPNGHPSSGCLYFFREGWNPSGTRFIAFLKDPDNGLSKAFSMTSDGTDVRYLYSDPTHHSWQDDDHILDFGHHTPPGGSSPLGGYFLFKDDGTGEAKNLLWATDYNGHNSYVPRFGADWIISDTYDIGGFQYLFMYHRPTKLFVPLAKLRTTAEDGIHRVDLHPRLSRDGRMVSIDSTYEGLGRQIYIIDISHIVANPPHKQRLLKEVPNRTRAIDISRGSEFHSQTNSVATQ